MVTIQKFDLNNSPEFTLAWKDPSSFNISSFNFAEQIMLENIGGVEIDFGGGHGKENNFKKIINQENDFLASFLKSSNKNCFLFSMEPFGQYASKSRSYKGFFKKERPLKNAGFIETETILTETETIFAGLVELDSSIIDSVIDGYFYNSQNNFIICGPQAFIFNNLFIDRIVKNSIQKNSVASINYAMLMLDYLRKDVLIIRAGGDGGDVCNSIQFFLHKSYDSALDIQIELHLKGSI